MSLPSTVQADSSPIKNTVGKESNWWDHNLWNRKDLSEESLTIMQCIPPKQDTSQNTIEKATEDVLDHKFKITELELDELTEIKLINDGYNSTVVKQESTSRRRSIGDLVERYKKVLEASNCATMKFKKEYIKHETK